MSECCSGSSIENGVVSGCDFADLRQDLALFETVLNTSLVGLYIVQDRKFCYVNPQFEKISGYTKEELLGRESSIVVLPEDRGMVRKYAVDMLKGLRTEPYQFRSLTRDGRIVWILEQVTSVQYRGRRAVLGNYMDITGQKNVEEKLQEANRQLQNIIEFLPDATFAIDRDGRVIIWNRAIEEMTGVKKQDIAGKGGYAYAVPFYGERRPMLIDLVFMDDESLRKKYDYIKREGKTVFAEAVIPSLRGREVFLWGKASPLYDSEGNVVGAIESIRDITDRRRAEERFKYLSLHDSLTGLYNRAYFEEELRREDGRPGPVSIVLIDIDGLKLVNNTIGHDAGDSLLMAAGMLIRNSIPDTAVVARIGGDEFAVLLPHCGEEMAQVICQKIKMKVEDYNALNPQVPLSISAGFAARKDASQRIFDLFKEADNRMHREKLNHSQSARSAIVQTLKKALGERDFVTGGHAERMQKFVTVLARAIGLPESKENDLRLLAQFHDIGKVGIPDRILFKPAELTREERGIMQRHCEIGCRIAMSAPDLVPIADWILKHHEWWDGGGYPLGLKGEEIPLECRILAIADAYDAMTSERPYRKPLSAEQALAELQRFSGRQFDPQLVAAFVKLITNSEAC